MNLRKWSVAHTKGLLVGILIPLFLVPLVLFGMAWLQDYSFDSMWFKFAHQSLFRSKALSLSIISNLIWFYRALNREKYDFAMGIILGSMCYLPYILYVNLILQ
jgi:hypothetical protein